MREKGGGAKKLKLRNNNPDQLEKKSMNQEGQRHTTKRREMNIKVKFKSKAGQRSVCTMNCHSMI